MVEVATGSALVAEPTGWREVAEQLTIERDQMRAVLRKIETGTLQAEGCPICGRYFNIPEVICSNRHSHDCDLAIVLGQKKDGQWRGPMAGEGQ